MAITYKIENTDFNRGRSRLIQGEQKVANENFLKNYL